MSVNPINPLSIEKIKERSPDENFNNLCHALSNPYTLHCANKESKRNKVVLDHWERESKLNMPDEIKNLIANSTSENYRERRLKYFKNDCKKEIKQYLKRKPSIELKLENGNILRINSRKNKNSESNSFFLIDKNSGGSFAFFSQQLNEPVKIDYINISYECKKNIENEEEKKILISKERERIKKSHSGNKNSKKFFDKNKGKSEREISDLLDINISYCGKVNYERRNEKGKFKMIRAHEYKFLDKKTRREVFSFREVI